MNGNFFGGGDGIRRYMVTMGISKQSSAYYSSEDADAFWNA